MQQNAICRSGSETKLALSSIHLICIQQVLIAQVCSNVQMVLQNRNITFKFIHTSDLSLFVIKCDYGVCLNFRRSGKIDQFWTNIRYVLAFYFIRTIHFDICMHIYIYIYMNGKKKAFTTATTIYIIWLPNSEALNIVEHLAFVELKTWLFDLNKFYINFSKSYNVNFSPFNSHWFTFTTFILL